MISWLPSPSAVILEPRKLKSVTVCIVSPSVCHEVMSWGRKESDTTEQLHLIFALEVNSVILLHGHFSTERSTILLFTINGFRTDSGLTQLCILSAYHHTLHTVGT